MFTYTKALPLALLISLPVIAMDKQVPISSIDEALTSTIVARQQFTEAATEVSDIQRQINELQAKKHQAIATQNGRAQVLEKKHTEKAHEIVSIRNLLAEVQKDLKAAETKKATELDEFETAYKKSKEELETQLHALDRTYQADRQKKEESHETVIRALAATKLKRETNLNDAERALQELHKDLTMARANGDNVSKGGLLAWLWN